MKKWKSLFMKKLYVVVFFTDLYVSRFPKFEKRLYYENVCVCVLLFTFPTKPVNEHLKSIEFNKLSREYQNKVEESMYAIMAEFKNTPLELDNTMSEELYEIIKNKWHYCLKMEKEIRESTLAQVMPD